MAITSLGKNPLAKNPITTADVVPGVRGKLVDFDLKICRDIFFESVPYLTDEGTLVADVAIGRSFEEACSLPGLGVAPYVDDEWDRTTVVVWPNEVDEIMKRIISKSVAIDLMNQDDERNYPDPIPND